MTLEERLTNVEAENLWFKRSAAVGRQLWWRCYQQLLLSDGGEWGSQYTDGAPPRPSGAKPRHHTPYNVLKG